MSGLHTYGQAPLDDLHTVRPLRSLIFCGNFVKKTIFKNVLRIPINASGQISDWEYPPSPPQCLLPLPSLPAPCLTFDRAKKTVKARLPISNEGRKSTDRTGIFTAVFSCSFTNREKQESGKKRFFKHGTYSRCGTPFIGDMACPTWNK